MCTNVHKRMQAYRKIRNRARTGITPYSDTMAKLPSHLNLLGGRARASEASAN